LRILKLHLQIDLWLSVRNQVMSTMLETWCKLVSVILQTGTSNWTSPHGHLRYEPSWNMISFIISMFFQFLNRLWFEVGGNQVHKWFDWAAHAV
jgi:hypothetical protein